MSFATILALAVGLLIAAPIVAHLLRRGKTREFEFPPAHLVPDFVVTSDQRRRLEDRLLLLLRALMVLALAVLGATPFVRCSRLSVERPSGASVAMALVLDDSQSMRATTKDGAARFALAAKGAEELLASLREGDAVAIILAGKPARLALSSTTDLTAAKHALEALQVTDRATDLSEAVQLGRAALKELPHADKRVVVLSDLATDELPAGEPPLWTPLVALTEPAANCGIAQAEQQSRAIVVTVACNDVSAARDRKLELVEAGAVNGEPLLSEPLNAADGEQTLQLRYAGEAIDLEVRFSGTDRLLEDDRAPVAKEAVEQTIAVVVDTARASVMTGGPTVLEQALAALTPDAKLKPLSGLPENAEDLRPFAAIVIDDPPGFSPAARNALQEWLERGGVALGLLGPAATSAQLAASSEPFARQGAVWEQAVSLGLDTKSLAWLGPEAYSLEALGNGGRVRLDAADLPGTEIVGAWEDGVPFMFRREVGRGLALTVGLPASVETSDLALRPGFLALLDTLLTQAKQRTGPRKSLAGSPWTFPREVPVSVVGAKEQPLQETPSAGAEDRRYIPEVTGRYQVTVDGKAEWRVVVLDPSELLTPPLDPNSTRASASAGGGDDRVNASPEWALLVLLLFAIELLIRAFGPRGSRPALERAG